jgi:hypothetical protein
MLWLKNCLLGAEQRSQSHIILEIKTYISNLLHTARFRNNQEDKQG